MRTTKLALGTLTALCLSLWGCDDAKKDAKDAKPEAKQAKAADGKAGDVKAAEAKVEAKAEDAKAADAKALEAKADPGAADPAAAGGDAAAKIGVAECDDYIAKMTACIASGDVAPEHLEAQKMGLEAYKNSWGDAMKSNPAEGPALVPGCKAALEMGRVSHPKCFEAK